MSGLLQQGWLKNEELADRFLVRCVELSTERCLSQLAAAGGAAGGGESSQAQQKAAMSHMDNLSKLILLLVRYHDEWRRISSITPEGLVNKIIGATAHVLRKHHTERKTSFKQKPFHRLLSKLLIDLNEPMGEHTAFAVCEALQALQPQNFSGFAFSWLELASHRLVMPRLLKVKTQRGWTLFNRLMVCIFAYLQPWLAKADLNEPIKMLYKGTLRVLLVLLHDFPEFLCEYHFSFCDVIPPSCIQLRNLILSAFPLQMALPDPFTPQLKVDMLPEINKAPTILANFTASIAAVPGLRGELDAYLKGSGSQGFLSKLQAHLMLPSGEVSVTGTRYNVPLINSIVLYSAIYSIMLSQGQGKQGPSTSGASMEIYVKLVTDLDAEGRYLVINAIANQLRFPNSHTHYLSCVLLFIFQASNEYVREQITRVLIERLIVNKPHPWGLLITFIELIKNKTYDLWKHDFVRSSREIEQLFQSVARFCLPQQQGQIGGADGDGDASKDSK
jgi:CCR4-NOT transcription complex subunit 1